MSNINDFVIEDGVLKRYIGSHGTVIIPDLVTSIGDGAFKLCKTLVSITIPDSVQDVGDRAFLGCESLRNIYYNGGIEGWLGIKFHGIDSNPMNWDSRLYINGELLTDIIIPDGVTSIGDDAFKHCKTLVSITIPDSVTSIGDHAFFDCVNLKTINIPDFVTSIGEYAFSGCNTVANITIPLAVTSIGKNAFSGCESLKDVYYNGDIEQWLGIEFHSNPVCNGAKLYAKGELVTDVALSNTVMNIGSAFSGCTSLESIEIPDTVTDIGAYAFKGCTALASIKISNSVTIIGERAFSCCKNLKKINIPISITSIGRAAFEFCTSLESISIPDSVNSIGACAFWHCTSLVNVTISKSIIDIGYRSFDGCTALTSIEVPDHVKNIEKEAFYNCTSLTSVKLGDSVTDIGQKAFEGCSTIKSVTTTSSFLTESALYEISKIDALEVVVAPNLSFEFLKKNKLALFAAMGYLMNKDMFLNCPEKESIKKYISSQRKKLLPTIFKGDLAECLALYDQLGIINDKNFDEEFFIPAQELKAIHCIAFLMNWRNENRR